MLERGVKNSTTGTAQHSASQHAGRVREQHEQCRSCREKGVEQEGGEGKMASEKADANAGRNPERKGKERDRGKGEIGGHLQ